MHTTQKETDRHHRGLGSAAINLSYSQLPASFFVPLSPTRFSEPKMFVLNRQLAGDFALEAEWLRSSEGLKLLSGGATLSAGEPIAMAYSGHQFGHFSPLLGDGRARLVGEPLDRTGLRHDLHLKGSGATPFSRGGDGKATLGSAIREYVISEAMAALGVPTTRSLSIVTTGETILREAPVPGAVLARTARSHVRVGTFQYAAVQGDLDHLKALADFSIDRLYPHIQSEGAKRYEDFLGAVAKAQAHLIAKWMLMGFIHGVMNTDNTSIAGETIDYGPCAFMDTFAPDKVFSSIDRQGRYAWNRQAEIGHWNLSQLAQSILPLLGDTEEAQIEAAQSAMSEYVSAFQFELQTGMANKLGLNPIDENLPAFVAETFIAMAKSDVDFTTFFTALTRSAKEKSDTAVRDAFRSRCIADAWLVNWKSMRDENVDGSDLTAGVMQHVNPVRIPRNHQVERAIRDGEDGNPEAMNLLLDALRHPSEESSAFTAFEQPPEPHETVSETFCGT